MVNASKNKGTAAESAVVRYLQVNGFPWAERRTLAGANDKGDIAGLPCTVEVKAVMKNDYGAWLREVEKERVNDGRAFGVVVHKPKGVGVNRPEDFRVVMTLATFLQMMRRRQ